MGISEGSEPKGASLALLWLRGEEIDRGDVGFFDVFVLLFVYFFFPFLFSFRAILFLSGRIPSPSRVKLGRRVSFVRFAVVHVNHDQRDEKKKERRSPRELTTKNENATSVSTKQLTVQRWKIKTKIMNIDRASRGKGSHRSSSSSFCRCSEWKRLSASPTCLRSETSRLRMRDRCAWTFMGVSPRDGPDLGPGSM